jgi:hypothetical protein
MQQSVFLLIPAENGGEFGERYVAALQRDPRVVLAHAQVAKHIAVGDESIVIAVWLRFATAISVGFFTTENTETTEEIR